MHSPLQPEACCSPSLSLFLSFYLSPPLFLSLFPTLQTQYEPIEEEGRNRRVANREQRNCEGVRRDLQGQDFSERKGWVVVETKGWGRAQVCWKDRTFEQSAVGGISELETIVILKVSPFNLCASPFLPYFLSAHHPYLPDLPQRITGQRRRLKWERDGWWDRIGGDRGVECITVCPSAHPHWQPLVPSINR